MNATAFDPTLPVGTITLARYYARKAVKAALAARDPRALREIEARDLAILAGAWLAEHPELIERAAETVRKVYNYRTLAERQQRSRGGIQR